MPGRLLLFLVAAAFTAQARAEEPKAAPAPDRPEHAQGFLSHGDSGDVMEDFYGSRVERQPRDDAMPSRKYDPAIRWDDRPIRR